MKRSDITNILPVIKFCFPHSIIELTFILKRHKLDPFPGEREILPDKIGGTNRIGMSVSEAFIDVGAARPDVIGQDLTHRRRRHR